jgi:hypothetical protein
VSDICEFCGSKVTNLANRTICTSCGHPAGGLSRGQNPTADEPPVSQSMAMIILTATVTASVVPFVQSIATEAGKDVYTKIKGLLARRVQPGEKAFERVLRIEDLARRICLHIGGTMMMEDDAIELPRLDLSDPRLYDGDIVCHYGWIFASDENYLKWNSERGIWEEYEGWRRVEPPGTTLRDMHRQAARYPYE